MVFAKYESMTSERHSAIVFRPSPTLIGNYCPTGLPSHAALFLETVGMLLLLGAAILTAVRGDSVTGITGTLTLMAAIAWRHLPAQH